MAKMRADDTYQGLCLISNDGAATIDSFDKMSPLMRKRLANSPFNICAACVLDRVYHTADGYRTVNEQIIEAIEWMEDKIRQLDQSTETT